MKSTVCVKSYGCSANFGNGEVIQGLLKRAGFEFKNENSKIIVMNVCTVKGNIKTLREIRKVRSKNKDSKLVITGCVTKKLAEQIRLTDPNTSIISTSDLREIVPAVNQTLHQIQITKFSCSKHLKLNLPRVRKNKIVGIVSICSGCLDACSFCSTKLIKGNLRSYPIKEIIDEIKILINDGCKEIWLTGQDTACYGFDIGTNIVELLNEILSIKKDFFVRIGMGNPRHVLRYVDKLVEIFKDKRLFKFIHLPVQSGNDDILKLMNRKHSVEEFVFIVKKIREKIPRMTISTDVICGFPTETEKQFYDTVRLLQYIEPEVVNISKFQDRERTLSFRMKDKISGEIKKNRSRLLTKLCHSIWQKKNYLWVGWEGEILIDEKGSIPGTYIGRNSSYKATGIKGQFRLGQKIKVRIMSATKFNLYSEQI